MRVDLRDYASEGDRKCCNESEYSTVYDESHEMAVEGYRDNGSIWEKDEKHRSGCAVLELTVDE